MTTISQMKAATEIKDKDVTVIVQDGNNRKASFELFFSRLKQFTTGNIPASWLKYLDEYNPIQTTDRFLTDARKELFALVNGGFNVAKSTPVQAPYYTITAFSLFSKVTQPDAKTPFKKLSSDRFALPISNIDTISPDVAAMPAQFIPTEAYGGAWSQFQYMGTELLHAVVKGSFKLYVKVADDANDVSAIPPSIWLSLRGVPRPNYERDDSIVLAMAGETAGGNLFKMNVRHFNTGTAELNPVYGDVYAAVKDTPSIDLKLLTGAIPLFSGEEQLDFTTTESYKTTSWIPCSDSCSFIFKTDVKSTMCRIQWKDATGKNYYDTVGIKDADSLYFTHPNAVAFRVQPSSPSSIVDSIKIWKLPKDFDPFAGLWTCYDFNVHALATFNSRINYALELRTSGGEKTLLTSDGFYIESGGLSILTNSRDNIQKTFETMLGE